MKPESKIYIAGHRGMVGSAIKFNLEQNGFVNIVTRTHSELDLTRQEDVENFFNEEKPDYVFLAAAKVGGINANNTYPANFIYENLAISMNIIHSSYKYKVKKLCNLGSSCIYPKMAPQPLKEEYLLTDSLEPTNEAYAIAKISAIKLCTYYNKQYGTDFISVMPTNLYGPNDNYHPENSHVLPALIRKFHIAKESGGKVTLWGDGSPYREFLYSEDLADAVIFLMQNRSASEIGEFVNIGTGQDLTIKELAEKIAGIVGYEGAVEWDPSKPNGTPRKLLDVSKLESLGWKAKVGLDAGIKASYQDFLNRELI